MPSHQGPAEWGGQHSPGCGVRRGRSQPAEILRSVQLFLHPRRPRQVDEQLALLPRYRDLGCRHAVLSFYQPPGPDLLEGCAAL